MAIKNLLRRSEEQPVPEVPTPTMKESEEVRQLKAQLWINSLLDEKVYRVELLQGIERIVDAINNLTLKLETITAGLGEEESK